MHEYFGRPDNGVRIRYRMRNGAILYTRQNRMDFHMIDEIWCYRKYDFFGFKIAPGEVVVDIGAHIGTFSIYASTVCKAGRIIAFEPHPENFRMLAVNIQANRISCCTAVNQAVAGWSGNGILEYHASNSGGHRLTEKPEHESTDVACLSLADIFTRYHINRIDYLKMDCEGSEYSILLNAPTDVMCQIGRISMEYHDVDGNSVEELAKCLHDHGFAVHLYAGHRLYAGRVV